MADTEEPQFTSLSARIAALNQSQNNQTTTFGKRPPPPLPTSSSSAANRPALQPRGQTANNPPIPTYGSAVIKQANNLPIGVKGKLLSPPPVDRDNPPPSPGNRLPIRNAPPPLPGRKTSQPSPALPPRRTSQQLARRGSNSSMLSVGSTISGMSLGQGSTTSVDTQTGRKLPPPLEQANLPPLPPTRREREELAKANKAPLVTTKSTPNIVFRGPPPVERNSAPKIPERPRLPSRPSSRNNDADVAPKVQPSRKLPPPAFATRSALSMGFNNKNAAPNKTETPNSAPTPAPAYNTRPTGPSVRELNDRNFDSVVMSGRPTLVDFYAPYCRYCKDLDPIWKELGQKFAHASDRIVIAKVDVNEYKSFMSKFDIQGYPTIMYFDGENEIPEKYLHMRELPNLTEFVEKKTGISAADLSVPPPINMSTKPTINMATRPSTSQIKALQSRSVPSPTPTSRCMLCRNFSGPDELASQYPRQSLPRHVDQTGYLADVLCSPFASATDKARAIFTWMHYNIVYDTVTFFGKIVKHVEPKDTIATGLAVCGGYAALYVAIALKAGLECVMVTGKGKGYGYERLNAGDPIPPCDPSGHAWNAVRIDGGEWKLLDACWGSGHVSNDIYQQKFAPSHFTMSNDEFGISHFPSNDAYFFRSDGRPQSWEDFVVEPVGDDPLQLYGNHNDHGLSPSSFSPPQKKIPVYSGEIIRFQFSRICEHWDPVINGAGEPYQMILKIHGVDGRKDDDVAFENNEFWWWADVPSRDLGAPGQQVSCYAVTSINGQDARGLTRRDYLSKKGKVGMAFVGISMWELV